jgi:hypothetical protein
MAIRMPRTLLLAILALAIVLAAAAAVGGQPQPQPKPEAPPQANEPAPPTSIVHPEADRRLRLAFPDDPDAVAQVYRVWIADGQIAFAAAELALRGGDRIQATQLRLAMFPDGKEAGKAVKTYPLVQNAVLRLDRAITSLSDLAKCKILAIEAVTPEPAAGPAPAAAEAVKVTEKALLQQKLEVLQKIEAVRIEKDLANLLIAQKQLRVDPNLGAQPHFAFPIDPKTPVRDLVPGPMKGLALPTNWANEDLNKVPEVAFGEPVAKTLTKDEALEATAHILAKINHVNHRKTDGFMLAMLDKRTDLRGLPVRMGEECRTREEQARIFAVIADMIRQNLQQAKSSEKIPLEAVEQFFGKFTEATLIGMVPAAKLGINRANVDHVQRATVAALMQILMPESENFRTGLARYLATVPQVDATRALAKLALFSPEDEVRGAAVEGLKTRRERDYTDILLEGFRYPLPAVSKRAAEALVKLERQDLLTNLVEVLERPDPRLPTKVQQGGKEVSTVRELVRVNHHRNCMLCHAPGNTETTPEGVLTVAVPLPNEALPKPSQGGYQSTPPASPDIVVRIDQTYLRQDFSLMMPVADAHPWPEMQRFDFLVRTRELTATEAEAYEPCCEVPEPGRLSPYHRSALFALRELTGRDTEPTAASWRKLLKLPSR